LFLKETGAGAEVCPVPEHASKIDMATARTAVRLTIEF
jgi:hypothetical protein